MKVSDAFAKLWNLGSSTFDKYPLKSVIAIETLYIVVTWAKVWGG